MAKKTSTPAPPIPAEFREQYESKFAPFPCEPNYKRGIDRLPDDVAGRLLKAILEHTVTGSTVPPEGMDIFAFDMLLAKVDEYLEHGLESKWKAHFRAHSGAAGTWGKRDAEGPEDAKARLSKHKHTNNNDNDNANDNVNANDNQEHDAQARGGIDISLADYLTDAEEERLVEAIFFAGGLMEGVLEKWVLSDSFRRADSLEEKERKLMQFKADLEAQGYAEREAAEIARKEEEKAARLAKYPKISAAALTAQTLADYFGDKGRAVDAEKVERIYQSIKAAELRGGVTDWRAYADKCAGEGTTEPTEHEPTKEERAAALGYQTFRG